MTRLADVIRSLKVSYPDRANEWMLATVLFLWGCVLQGNPGLFATSASYGPLGDLMPQPTWALLCFGAGAARLVALAINGAYRRTPHMRAGTAFLSCLFWFYISLGFLQSGAWSTGLAVYPVFLWFDGHNVLRVAAEAAVIDRKNAGRRHHGNYT